MQEQHVLLALDIGTSSIKYRIMPHDNGPAYQHIASGTLEACYKPVNGNDLAQTWDTLKKPVTGQYGTSARQSGGGLHRHGNIYESPAYPVYIFAGIAEALNQIHSRADHIIIDELGIGFPISHESRAQDIASYLSHAGNPWEVAISGMSREYAVSIPRVFAQTQPYYVALDQVYQWLGGPFHTERGRELFKRGGFLVIDAGSNSIDFRYQVGSLASSGQFVAMKGTFSMLDALKSRVYSKLHYNPQDHELMHEILRTGKLFFDGEMHDFRADIRELMTAQWQTALSADIETGLSSLPSVPASVIMSGGGAYDGIYAMHALYPKRFRYGIHLAKDDDNTPECVERVVSGIMKQLIINAGKREKGVEYHDIRG